MEAQLTNLLDIRELRPADTAELADFFSELADDSDVRRWFHPHPFTPERALWICDPPEKRQDIYFGAFLDGRIVGYAMLRGWDEGYDTPAFGVAVFPGLRGKGIGRRLLGHAIVLSQERRAPRLMLKCYRENAAAHGLYESMGFVWTGSTEDQAQDIGYREISP